jgi:voltage-gated potassium channel
MARDGGRPETEGWRKRWHDIIFESDTPAGKQFDVWLLVAIGLSVAVVMLESVNTIDARYGDELRIAEWVFTVLFTIEYVMRLRCVRRPMGYALSFYGLVDLLAIVPTYVSLLFPGTQALAVVRTLRLLRVFRILKLVHYLKEIEVLARALRASGRKITVFIASVLMAVTVLGSLMYLVEGGQGGFTSIPTSVYWAIVTLTTVGYGDISPQTPIGQILAAVIMILGYGIIAVPTGVVTMEVTRAANAEPRPASGQSCEHCMAEGHPVGAQYCHGCGEALA